MAGGWTRDGAEQEQIDATVEDALKRARQHLPEGESAVYCEACDEPIAKARRQALRGVRYCVECQEKREKSTQSSALFNRRGSKDSQLR